MKEKIIDFLIYRKFHMGTFLNVPLYFHSTTVVLSSLLLIGCIWNISCCIPLMAFLFVILHEYGHIYAGQKRGFETISVIVLPVGAAAQMDQLARPSAKDELIVALAGPLVNFAFAILFIPIYFFYSPILLLININIVIGIFNMLPAFPMDGGRVLRACLHGCFGNFEKATEWACLVSNFLSAAMLVYGIFNFIPSMIIIPIFLFMYTRIERTRLQEQSDDDF